MDQQYKQNTRGTNRGSQVTLQVVSCECMLCDVTEANFNACLMYVTCFTEGYNKVTLYAYGGVSGV
jgi:hypothetical protein